MRVAVSIRFITRILLFIDTIRTIDHRRPNGKIPGRTQKERFDTCQNGCIPIPPGLGDMILDRKFKATLQTT